MLENYILVSVCADLNRNGKEQLEKHQAAVDILWRAAQEQKSMEAKRKEGEEAGSENKDEDGASPARPSVGGSGAAAVAALKSGNSSPRLTRSGSVVQTAVGVVLYPPISSVPKGSTAISYDWKDMREVYKQMDSKPGAALLPDDLGPNDIEQGSHSDCFFLTACALLAHHPAVIKNLFVTKEWPEEQTKNKDDEKGEDEKGEEAPTALFKFRFWRWDRWQEVHVDSRVPLDSIHNSGLPLHARASSNNAAKTPRAWPLLLEKAYAAFYGGYESLSKGSNLAETLHDLTGGLPVQNFCFDPAVSSNLNWNLNPLKDAEFWSNIQKQQKEKGLLMSALANPEIPASTLGLRKSYVYGVLGVYYLSRGVPNLDGFVVKLLCPYKGDEYIGPLSKKNATVDWKVYDESAMKQHGIIKEGMKFFTAANTEPYPGNGMTTFYMPLTLFLETFGHMQVCSLGDTFLSQHSTEDSDGGDLKHARLDMPFEFAAGRTAGGRMNYTSWRQNPAFLVRNDTGKAVDILVTVKQPEWRRVDRTQRQGENTYLRAGISLVELGTQSKDGFSPWTQPTSLRTAANCKVLQKPFYFNQRETSTLFTIPAETKVSYLVPSTYEQNEESEMLFSVDSPAELNASDFSVQPCSTPMLRGKGTTEGCTLEETWETQEGKSAFFKVALRGKLIEGQKPDNEEESGVRCHVLLRQKEGGKKVGKGEPDTITEHFVTMEVQQLANHKRIAALPAATNYREMGLVVEVPANPPAKGQDGDEGAVAVTFASDLLLAATCAKGPGTLTCQVSVWVEKSKVVEIDAEQCTLSVVKVQQPSTGQPASATALAEKKKSEGGDGEFKPATQTPAKIAPKTPPPKKSAPGKVPAKKAAAVAPAAPSPPKSKKAPGDGASSGRKAPVEAKSAAKAPAKQAPQPPAAKKATAPAKAAPKAPAGKKVPAKK